MDKPQILLVYDTQCPACDNYCKLVRINEQHGKLKLVDAREDSAVMDEITARGMDVDQGMVIKIGQRLYYGADAIHQLALISNRSGVFNKMNNLVFRSNAISHALYPVLRGGRHLLLKVLRKTRINNLHIDGNKMF